MTKGELSGGDDSGLYARGDFTMIGHKRLCNIEALITDVVEKDVPGDVIEAGVWKGGAVIYMKYLLEQLGSDKKVFVADSFDGLPPPDPKYPMDAGWDYSKMAHLAVSEEKVRSNFEHFGLLDERVIFVKGLFKDTLAAIPGPFSIIRLDGDMYESTLNSLDGLYHKLSPGGYCIIDDWGLAACNAAVVEFRNLNGVTDTVVQVDGFCVYWQKTTSSAGSQAPCGT